MVLVLATLVSKTFLNIGISPRKRVKMKLGKRILTGILAGAMTLGTLTGCKASVNTGSAKREATKTADGKIEIEFWFAGGKTAVKVIQGIVDDYNKSQDKYYVKAVVQADYDETYQKLQASIAGNVAPDVALIEVVPTYNLATKGLLTDLTDTIANDSEFDKDDYINVFMEQGMADGKNYALPAYGTTQVFYYNRALFEKAGVKEEDIKTWNDLNNAYDKVKAAGGTYVWEPMWGPDNLVDVSLSNGAKLLSDDGKTVLINSPEWVEVWDSFGKWINTDKTMAIHSGGEGWEYWYSTMDDAVNGVAGGYTGSSGDQADLDFSVVAAMEQPAWKDGTVATPTAESKNLVSINASSDEEKAGAYDFMKFFTNPENQANWSINTGYVPVRSSAKDTESYKAYSSEHPEILVPLAQSQHATVAPIDPTGGAIYDALKTAADKVEIEGVPAKEALDEACKTAQAALDKINK